MSNPDAAFCMPVTDMAVNFDGRLPDMAVVDGRPIRGHEAGRQPKRRSTSVFSGQLQPVVRVHVFIPSYPQAGSYIQHILMAHTEGFFDPEAVSLWAKCVWHSLFGTLDIKQPVYCIP